MMNALRKLHSKLIGDVETTRTQARIFHEVIIIGIFSISIGLIVNLFIGVPYVNYILILTFLCFLGLYYNSRYLGNIQMSILVFTLSATLILPLNYYFNSGIKGPTLLVFLASAVFTVAMMPLRSSLFWIVLNTVVVGVMLYVEYAYPELIKDSYTDRAGLFLDTFTTYVAIVACIIVVLSYMIRSQHYEKMKAVNASKALQEANDSKTKLLSILSHDLRSPLNSIQSFLEILVDFDLEEEERKAINSTLLKETKSTQDMLLNLLSWTKSQMDGGIKVTLATVNVYETLETCIGVQQSAALEKTITIKNLVDPELEIIADIDMFKLVIRNLLNNAIKFTKLGGEILTTSDSTENEGILVISDNGIGIDGDKAARVFTMNSESTYGTNNEKGVGLGLLLCKEFTELQGGKISLTTSVNKGTSFYLHFPLSSVPASESMQSV